MAPAVTEAAGDDLATARPQRPAGPSRIPWAELLLRVFREDVLVCPCGGRRVVLAFVTEKKIVKEILEHLGLPTTGPPVAPARIAANSSKNQDRNEIAPNKRWRIGSR